MSESTAAIVPIEAPKAAELMRVATDVAGVCRDIVFKTAQTIGKKKYVRVEGWQSIATAYGCVASARDVETIAGGVRAIGEIRRISDGAVLATAEGFVGEDEETWAKRPMFARRAMAQTRAISRACRSAFAFVVVMIDAELSTTPAEEMDAMNDNAPIKPTGQVTSELKAKVAAKAATVDGSVVAPPASPPRASRMQIQEAPADLPFADNDSPRQADLPMAFGSGKGKPLAELTAKDLGWYAKVLEENVDDPDKQNFREKNQAALDSIRRELKRRG